MSRDRVFGVNDKGQYSPRELNRISLATLEDKLAAVRKAQADGDFIPEMGFGSQIDLGAIDKQHEAPAKDGLDEGGLDEGADLGGDLGGGEAEGQEGGDALRDAVEALMDPSGQADVEGIVASLSPSDLEALSSPKILGLLQKRLPEETFSALQSCIDSAGTSEGGEAGGYDDATDSFPGGENGPAGDAPVGDSAMGGGEDELTLASAKAPKRFASDKANVERTPEENKGIVHQDVPIKPLKGGNEKVEQPEIREGGDVAEVEQPEIRESRSLLPTRVAGKVVFTDPIQLSDEACEAARVAGDTQLYRTIVAARNDRRTKAVEAYAQIERQKVASAKVAPVATKVARKDMKFKSPTDFNAAEKAAFAHVIADLGFPEVVSRGVVANQTTSRKALAAKRAGFLTELKGIAESTLSTGLKTAAVKELVRTANDQALMKDAYDYWADFYDKEWAKALFLDEPKQAAPTEEA